MNQNLVIWTSDWHVVSDGTDTGNVGDTKPADALAVSQHIASLDPYGVIDTGDCKDHYLADQGDTSDEHDRYHDNVYNVIPWLTLEQAGYTALKPILPGNHDEIDDSATVGSVSDFSIFNSKFWGPPYHWTANWPAAKIKFIAIHTYIHHQVGGLGGFFHCDADETAWLATQLAGLGSDWMAIVCSHASTITNFGAEVRGPELGGNELRSTIYQYKNKIAACFNGHRHSASMGPVTVNGIPFFNGPGMAYIIGNSHGAFVTITYDPAARTLTFDEPEGPPSAFARLGGFTPVVVTLPALPTARVTVVSTRQGDHNILQNERIVDIEGGRARINR